MLAPHAHAQRRRRGHGGTSYRKHWTGPRLGQSEAAWTGLPCSAPCRSATTCSCPIRKAGGGVSALCGLLGKERAILSPEVPQAGTSGVERMFSDVVSGSALTPKCCKEALWGWCLLNLGNWRIPWAFHTSPSPGPLGLCSVSLAFPVRMGPEEFRIPVSHFQSPKL